MQKQYVIRYTAPAIDIAFQLAHRQTVLRGIHPRTFEVCGLSRRRWGLGDHPAGAHLLNFPFAMTIFLILSAGLMIIASGTVATNLGLTITGCLVTLAGTLLLGVGCNDTAAP